MQKFSKLHPLMFTGHARTHVHRTRETDERNVWIARMGIAATHNAQLFVCSQLCERFGLLQDRHVCQTIEAT